MCLYMPTYNRGGSGHRNSDFDFKSVFFLNYLKNKIRDHLKQNNNKKLVSGFLHPAAALNTYNRWREKAENYNNNYKNELLLPVK